MLTAQTNSLTMTRKRGNIASKVRGNHLSMADEDSGDIRELKQTDGAAVRLANS